MNASELSDEQRGMIERWAGEGCQLPEIQRRLKEEAGLGLTFMETRLLVLEMGLEIKAEEEKEVSGEKAPGEAEGKGEEEASVAGEGASGSALGAVGDLAAGVEVTLDQVAVPGAMVSGRVVFSDGERARWYVDDLGRLGLETETPGYRPSEGELSSFQAELRKALGER